MSRNTTAIVTTVTSKGKIAVGTKLHTSVKQTTVIRVKYKLKSYGYICNFKKFINAPLEKKFRIQFSA